MAEQAAEEQVWQCCLLIHGRFLVAGVGRFLSGRAHSLKSSQKPSASKIFLGLFGSQSQYGARAVDGQWMGAGPPFLTSSGLSSQTQGANKELSTRAMQGVKLARSRSFTNNFYLLYPKKMLLPNNTHTKINLLCTSLVSYVHLAFSSLCLWKCLLLTILAS